MKFSTAGSILLSIIIALAFQSFSAFMYKGDSVITDQKPASQQAGHRPTDGRGIEPVNSTFTPNKR